MMAVIAVLILYSYLKYQAKDGERTRPHRVSRLDSKQLALELRIDRKPETEITGDQGFPMSRDVEVVLLKRESLFKTNVHPMKICGLQVGSSAKFDKHPQLGIPLSQLAVDSLGLGCWEHTSS